MVVFCWKSRVWWSLFVGKAESGGRFFVGKAESGGRFFVVGNPTESGGVM